MSQEAPQSQNPFETVALDVSVLDGSPEKNASSIVIRLLQAMKDLPESINMKNPGDATRRVFISVTSHPENVSTSERSSVPVNMITALVSKGESLARIVSVKHDIDDSSELGVQHTEVNLPRVLTVTMFPGTDREKVVFHASGDAQSLNSTQGIDPKKGGLIHVCDLNGKNVAVLCTLFEEAKRQHAETLAVTLAAQEKQRQEKERRQREAERMKRMTQQKAVSDALKGLLEDAGIEL